MGRPVFIYALIDPRTEQVRYVGQSVDPKRRLADHIAQARSQPHTPRDHWLVDLLAGDVWPALAILEAVPDTEWPEAERRWIAHFRASGVDILNSTDGGKGVSHRTTSGLVHFDDETVMQIRHEYAAGDTYYYLARRYDTSHTNIRWIVTGRSHGHLPLVDASHRVPINRRARGGKNASRLYPERRPRGDGHWTRQRCTDSLKGEHNGMVKHPESRRYGPANNATKLTEDQKTEIRKRRQAGERCCDLAIEFGVSAPRISQLGLGRP